MPRQRLSKLDPAIRTRILEAARAVFAEHGYEQASLNAIIEQAGISKGVLYYYFEDKVDLYLAILHEIAEAQAKVMSESKVELSGDYWQDMRMLMYQRAVMVTQDPETSRLFQDLYLQAQKPVDRNPFRDYLDQENTYALEVIRLGQESGKMRKDMSLPLLSDLLFTISDVLTKSLLVGKGPLPEEELERFADLQLRVIRSVVEPAA